MTNFISDAERDEYLNNECTPSGEDGCFKFLCDDVAGLFTREPKNSGMPWAIRMISEEQDWVSSSRPECFPLNCIGSYRYLIKPTAFDFEKEIRSITKDFLNPWGGVIPFTNGTKWIVTETEKGNLRQGYSRHPKYRNIRRYILYYTDPQHRPLSNVLYQYVVEPPQEKKPKKGFSPKIQAQKRKSEPLKPRNTAEIQRNVVKRRKTEIVSASQIQETTQTTFKRTVVPRKVNEEKPFIPSPPISETSITNNPNSTVQNENIYPALTNLENAHSGLQKVLAETKNRYCAMTDPMEMTATNGKLIRLVRLQSELEAGVASLTEYMKTKADEILTAPAQEPVYQAPVSPNNDSSENDNDEIQILFPVKSEPVDIE